MMDNTTTETRYPQSYDEFVEGLQALGLPYVRATRAAYDRMTWRIDLVSDRVPGSTSTDYYGTMDMILSPGNRRVPPHVRWRICDHRADPKTLEGHKHTVWRDGTFAFSWGLLGAKMEEFYKEFPRTRKQ